MRIKLEVHDIWVTSDLHWCHSNIIKYDNRPFSSIEEMNETLIKNWNSKINKNDYVFYLGDLSFGTFEDTKKIVNRLNGKIHFIMGNHDKYKDIKGYNRFVEVNDYCELRVKDDEVKGKQQLIVMSHYPILEWNQQHRGSWMLHGHCHGSLMKNSIYDWFYKKKVIDVGCNMHNYTPLSYNEIKNIMLTKETSKHH